MTCQTESRRVLFMAARTCDPVHLSTTEAAKALVVSRPMIYALMREGKLAAIPGSKPIMFLQTEVARLLNERANAKVQVKKKQDHSEFGLRAFALFDKKADLRTCMRELHCSAGKVRELYNEWRTPLGGKPRKTLAELAADSEAEHENFNQTFDEEIKAQRKRFAERHDRAMRLLLSPLAKRRKKEKV